MKERIQRWALGVLSLVFLAAACRNWFVTVREVRRFYTNLPIWDAFDYFTHFARWKQFDLSVLWLQHNEHRSIGTEVVYAIDMLLFHERQVLTTVVGIAGYVGVLLVFVAFAFGRAEEKKTIACGAFLIAAISGYKLCAVSLANPFLTCWTQFEFLTVAALASIAMHKQRGGKLLLLLAIVFAAGSTYSVASGMFVWPVLLLAAVCLRFQMKELVLLAAAAAASIGLYFFHYQNLHTFGISAFVGHPLYGIKFLGSFLGMPFGVAYEFGKPWLAVLCGWLGLVIAAADAVWILNRRLFREPAVIVLGGFCLVMMLSAITTAIGRMNPEDPYFQASMAGRYITEPTLFWCALVMLSVWLIGSAGKGFVAIAFMLGIAVFASLTLKRTGGYYAWWEDYFRRWQWAEIAVGNGAIDKEVSDVVNPSPEFMLQGVHMLAANHLAVFADAEPGWIGRQASELFGRGTDGLVRGEVTLIKRRGLNYELQGWAEGATKFVFIDEDGRVIGYGMRPEAGPTALYTHDMPAGMAFTGFVRGEFGSHEFSVWTLDRKEKTISRMGQLRNELLR